MIDGSNKPSKPSYLLLLRPLLEIWFGLIGSRGVGYVPLKLGGDLVVLKPDDGFLTRPGGVVLEAEAEAER